MCVLSLYVSKRKTFFYLTKYSRLLLDWPRTAHSICVTSEEKQAVRMQMSRSEIEKREPLISCFIGLCSATSQTAAVMKLRRSYYQKDFMPIITTHGQLVEFDNPFTTEESRLIYTTLYSKFMSVSVCLWWSKTTLFSYRFCCAISTSKNRSLESDLLN